MIADKILLNTIAVSSIVRPNAQQCNIVDVKDWDDLFFGSGVA